MSPSLPPVRACLFDMDGLLLNTEDIYTTVTNTILLENGRPPLPWSIKAQLQGRPGPAASEIFHAWAQLPMDIDAYHARISELQRTLFPSAAPLPGTADLLQTLIRASPENRPDEKIHIALATSSHRANFELKTSHLKEFFAVFPEERVVVGDDPRVPKGRGKPAPDIYLLALETINAGLRKEGKEEVRPEECLVFEDAVPGVEAGRRAGMRVVWVPQQGLLEEYKERVEEVLAGATGEADTSKEGHWGEVGKNGDGMAELRMSLEGFGYERYGIVVPN
ncbi:HAD-like protein [Ascodesmis nigricans]|uniref:HAD-like protein n=1 Tax=Ascodesmis nigricans TaxID=341454 RepID=A0A4S2N1Z1_9PEZI|nr:HAD-like protein [Ascodesmis nigricans]